MRKLGKMPDWKKTLRSVVERRRAIPKSAGESLQQFFEQAFRHAQVPSASWFGFHGGGATLVIGNYYLAALIRRGIYILVDSNVPKVSGFRVERASRSKRVKWVFTSAIDSVKNLLGNNAFWASFANASRLALGSPDGRPRKDSFYLKKGKMRLCDFWPEKGRGHLLQELDAAQSELKTLEKTEAEAIRLSRIGQGRFRDSLLALWAECSVTGCKATRILRASHLKPWADSSNRERLDPYNGLLLIPNLDAALDVGLISFDDDGKIQLSSQLSAEDAANLGIGLRMKISPVSKRHLKYLGYHRKHVFIE